jgi:hypothetical protein
MHRQLCSRVLQRLAHRLNGSGSNDVLAALTHDRLLPFRPTPGDRAPDANGCQSGARQIAEIFPTVQRKEYDLSIVGCDLSDADG